ncbi:bifunctional 3,4-dihydroxy-2-butanone-4-phosphate synthase/GTP cyclohydrolase II [Candidatus Pacearchaeota archaeon]|nr:bifunctional 3,4-dihydroxy-2-butanone-4-phosphate synthase/GTP cyclohydrolase II [Candidatus Pacearchaeota archaeon]
MNNIESALEGLKVGKMIIVTDDENRENEGDLVFAAEHATPENINFMIKEGRGLICVPIEEETAYRLNFHPMTQNPDGNCNFTVSVDAKQGITTGISAADRALTIQKIVNSDSQTTDFIRPGHIFPLVAKPGGVLSRAGHTEAAVDLMKLADLNPAGVICEIMNDDGTMSRLPDLEVFAEKHQLKIITIKDLIDYIKTHPTISKEESPSFFKEAESGLSTRYGKFRVHVYRDLSDHKEHVAFVMGDLNQCKNPLVRIHSECLTGDIFHSKHCDCGNQLDQALKNIADKGCGVLLYMRQEGRGIGLSNKIKAYDLQAKGYDTVEANEKLGFKSDLRDYSISAQILKDLGIESIEMLTNNPRKLDGLEKNGIKILKRVSIEIPANEVNINYLKTKKRKMGHLFKNF